MDILTCSSEGCITLAAESLILRGLPGHVHDCPEHAHDLREWCDVTYSAPIVEGVCQIPHCTGARIIGIAEPTSLD